MPAAFHAPGRQRPLPSPQPAGTAQGLALEVTALGHLPRPPRYTGSSVLTRASKFAILCPISTARRHVIACLIDVFLLLHGTSQEGGDRVQLTLRSLRARWHHTSSHTAKHQGPPPPTHMAHHPQRWPLGIELFFLPIHIPSLLGGRTQWRTKRTAPSPTAEWRLHSSGSA